MGLGGINTDPSHGLTAEQVYETGAIWHRLVLRLDRDVRPYCDAAHALGGKVLGVLDSDSLGLNPDLWAYQAVQLSYMYGEHVDGVQPFNEPDAPPGTHGWPLTIYVLCKGIEEVVTYWRPRSAATIYGPGLSNSKPWYLDEIDWASLGLDGIACQGLYGRWPTEEFKDEPACQFGSAPELLDRFTARAQEQNLLAIVSEWGYKDFEWPGAVPIWWPGAVPIWWSHDHGHASAAPVVGAGRHGAIVGDMAHLLASDDRLEMAIHFCLSDLMVPGFGLLDSTGKRKVAWHSFRAAQKERQLPEPDLDLEAQLDQRIDAKIRATPFAGAEYLPRANVPGLGRVAFTDAGVFFARIGVPGCYLLRDEIMPVPLRG